MNPWLPFGIGLVVIVGIGVVAYFLLAGSDEAKAEVILQTTADDGPDPFTESVADMRVDELTSNGDDIAGDPVQGVEGGDRSIESIDGAAPGLYGGSEQEQVCDPEAMVEFLEENPDKAQAWADAQGIAVDDIEDFVATLTPVILREDTRVTNNGFDGSSATPFQAVLQAGTAVLVDDRGVPRVRCACGNPLGEPEATDAEPDYTGEGWGRFDSDRLVAVSASGERVDSFRLVDIESGREFDQPAGGGGGLTIDELLSSSIPICGLPSKPLKDGVHPDDGAPLSTSSESQIAYVIGTGEADLETEGGEPAAAVGDLTGDGVDDGAVVAYCNAGSALGFSQAYAIDSSGEFLGEVPIGDDGIPSGLFRIRSLDVAIADGILTETVSAGAAISDPSTEVEVDYEYDGSEFVFVGSGGSSGGSSGGDSGGSSADSEVPSDAESCGGGVYVNSVTTCPFALDIADAVAADPDAGTYRIYSAATDRTYTMTCAGGGTTTVCSGGDDAMAYITDE